MSSGSDPRYDAEKNAAFTSDHDIPSEHYTEGLGDLQVLKVGSNADLKLAKDGKTVLIPQPSDDPNDPLNWSSTKKHVVLASLIPAALLCDYGMAYGVPLFAAQSITFHMSLPEVAHSISGGLFLQGPGGLVAVPLVQRYGRLPVLFWSQFLSAMMVMAAALSPNYACFTAFRALQGFVNSAPQVIGLSIIHDIFFFHERTRRINIWVLCFMGGPALGPFISAWLVTAISWRAIYGFLAALHGLSMLIVIFLGDETLYDRANPQPVEGGFFGKVKLLLGITGGKMKGRPTLWSVSKLIVHLQFKPQILFITTIYITILFAWVTGVTTTILEILEPPPYSFGPDSVALAFLGPLVGAIIGHAWGHWFNDWLCKRYIKKHDGKYVLENRLWGCYAPTLIAFGSLILYGQAIERSLNWSALIIPWSGLTLAMIASSTVVSAYILDSFPWHASLVGGIANMWRTAGGFCVNYYQLPWMDAIGPEASFGCQAMILGVAFICSVVVTQIWGQKWRQRHSPPPPDARTS